MDAEIGPIVANAVVATILGVTLGLAAAGIASIVWRRHVRKSAGTPPACR